MLRLAVGNNISRDEFIKFYVGNEINPNLKKFLDTNPTWSKFFQKYKEEFLYLPLQKNKKQELL